MTTDIYSRIAVDVVIFTVVENETLESLIDLGFVSPPELIAADGSGLSLFVVTMKGDTKPQLPGGFLESNETIEQAAHRIALSKLGISIKTKLRGLAPFDSPNRDPDQRTISFPYWAMVNFEDIRFFLGGRDRVALELVSSQKFMDAFSAENSLEQFDGVSRFGNRRMPNAQKRIAHAKQLTSEIAGGRILSFDHDDMVFYAWRQLRHAFNSKLDPFRFLGINPLGNEFRMSDLQEFQEVCLGTREQRDTFKRQMLNSESYLRASSGTDKSRPGKPAILYSLAAPPSNEGK